MSGKIIINSPKESMGILKLRVFINDVEQDIKLKRNERHTFIIEEDSYIYGVLPHIATSDKFKVSSNKVTEIQFIYKQVGSSMGLIIETLSEELIQEVKHQEYRKKCNVCGHIFCYTIADLEKNQKLYDQVKSSRNSVVLNAFFGSKYSMYESSKEMDQALEKIVDYDRCPNCKSSDLSDVSEEELKWSQTINGNNNSVISVADELKKFKELLDMGIITQEEFDAKKKQLLGL